VTTSNQRIASTLGGGAGVDGSGLLTLPSYTVQGQTFNNVGGALGANATASGNASSAMGQGASAAGDFSVAIGQGASAPFANSVAIGQGAAATRANQVALGNTANTYTLPGLASAASRAAQSGPLQLVTADANGNLGTTTLPAGFDQGSLSNAIGNLQGQVSELTYMLRRDRQRADAGTALALSATGLRYNDRPGKTSVAGATSYYRNQAGLALGIGHTSEDGRWRFNAAGTAVPDARRSDLGVVVGASYTLD
jgi:autotransporter adhesin